MHSAKGGRRGKEVALHPCFMVSVSMESPCPGREGEWEQAAQGRHSELDRDAWVPLSVAVAGRPDGRQIVGICSSCQPVWHRVPHPSRAVLTQCNSGAQRPQRSLDKMSSSFPEFRTLSSSGNHASLVLTLKLTLHQFRKFLFLLAPFLFFFLFNHF